MPKYLTTEKTNKDLIAVCDLVLTQLKNRKIPQIGEVIFEHATVGGWCQQNVREAVEACAFGKEWTWEAASCCATSTLQRLRHLGYFEVSLREAMPGDLVYWTGIGRKCRTCGQDAGHAGILHHLDGKWYVWQNLNGVRISEMWQKTPAGIFRLFPLEVKKQMKINWWGHYLPDDKVIFKDGEHYVNLRAAAKAEGSAVFVDENTRKVFVGPRHWWKKEI